MTPPSILLSAGEASGDLHGAALALALRRRWPEVRLFGLGGPRMAAAGVELLSDSDRMGVMGFVEAVRHLPFHYGLLRRLRREIEERRPALVIPIDYPGFNLRLARVAHESSVPVLYYIAPQVWAWHRSRTVDLARYSDRLAVVLPFEEPLFREAGARATFVGHPLLDTPPVAATEAEFRARAGIVGDGPLLAVFPGSRIHEIRRHLDLFLETVERIRAERPDVQPVIAESDSVPPESYDGVPFARTTDSWGLLHYASAALLKSGTGTLEAALAGTPMVIAYRTHPFTFWLARRLVRVDHIGLANLVAGERIVPEFLQKAATPATLAAALLPLLDDGDGVRSIAIRKLAGVRAALAPNGAAAGGVADRVAALAAELVT